MSSESPLISVVERIATLLDSSGLHEDRVAWLRSQVAVLRAPDVTPDATEHVQDQLRRSIHGMGGLLDITLGSGPGAIAARATLDTLVDEMYVLVRS